jgi:hypothetical protein
MPQTVFTASPPPFDGVPRRDTTIQAHLDPTAKLFISPYTSSSVLSAGRSSSPYAAERCGRLSAYEHTRQPGWVLTLTTPDGPRGRCPITACT